MSGSESVRIGTRGSALALYQTRVVEGLLRTRYPGVGVEVVPVRTQGDMVQDRPVSQFADKGVFVRALETALLDDEVDLAVHSLKDVPSDVDVPGLELVAFPQRADPRDVLVSGGVPLLDLPLGARVGTSSIRRRVQLLAVRPDLRVMEIRGNVDTRLRRYEAGEYDAIVLAAAGLKRLGLEGAISQYLAVDMFTPDAGQGILAIQARVGSQAARLAAELNVPDIALQARAERAVVREMGATCRSPVGALLRLEGEDASLVAMAADERGRVVWRVRELVARQEVMPAAAAMGRALAELVAPYTEE